MVEAHPFTDSKQGDMVCTDCGMVQEARIVSQDIEYRLFEGDIESRKKMRIGAAYNHYLRHNFFGSKRKWERDVRRLRTKVFFLHILRTGKRVSVGWFGKY